MAFSDPVTTVTSGLRLVDGVLWDRQWSDGSPAATSIAVYIAGTSAKEVFDFGGSAVAASTVAAEAAAFQTAMQLIENVCNVDFLTAGSQASADLILGVTGNINVIRGSLGVAVPPGEDAGPLADQQGAAIVNRTQYQTTDYSSLQQGGYDFISFIHELGHAVGLKHPHDRGGGTFPKFPGVTSAFDDYGDFNLNQGINTMMSYNDGFPTGPLGKQKPAATPDFGWEGTPMAVDIAALQHMYGANTSFHAGDDLYVLPGKNAAGNFYSCIWDAGGSDTIAAGGRRGCTIDLNPASLNIESGGGGWVSSHKGISGGLTIAHGVVIENATGGLGADRLIGNSAANRLTGKGGDDLLIGGLGADALSGGAGADIFRFEDAGDSRRAGADRISDFGSGDLIDLSAIDADGAAGSRNSFVFMGTDGFGGGHGELRCLYKPAKDVTLVLGDIDGNGSAEFKIVLAGHVVLDATDFIL